MDSSVANLRVHFYGTQGSGSVFPRWPEREKLRELMGCRLLEGVFKDLSRRGPGKGRLGGTIEEVLGGEPTPDNLLAYYRSLALQPPPFYGGWTTCVRVETADGEDLVFDCGSGFRNCAQDLQDKWGEENDREVHIFGSHSHFDHTEGFDQAVVCFDPRNTIRLYGNSQFLWALDSYLGIFSRRVPKELLKVQSPIFYDVMPARFEGVEIGKREETSHMLNGLVHVQPLEKPITIGQTLVTPVAVHHPAPCLAYSVERAGKKFVFCTDHELRRGPDPADSRQRASFQAEEQLRHHAREAHVLYRDGQYLRSEYDGEKGIGSSKAIRRLDWGHSCIEDVRDMAIECEVARTYVGHHDPNREWTERNWLNDTLCRGSTDEARIELAMAETVIDL